MEVNNSIDKSSFANLNKFSTNHIDLNLTIDFNRKICFGSAELDILRLQQSNDNEDDLLILDTRDLLINRIHINQQDCKFIVNKPVSTFGSSLYIYLPSSIKNVNQFKLIIDYSTTNKCTAIQWLDPSKTCGKQFPYMFTQCQAIHARSLVPCMDSPSIKLTYNASIIVAKPLVPIMSAINRNLSVKEVKLEDGTLANIYHFKQPERIPTYLIALACGNLVSKEIGPRSLVWTEPEMLDECVWEFDTTENFIQSAEKYLPKYCWNVYDLLVLPGSFPYGGMENPCLTFVTPTLLAGDKSLVDVVAHEISHSWCGNLVTSKNWESFWLNEGWTVYVERLILKDLHGEDNRLFSATIGWRALQDSIEQFGKTNQLTALVPNLTNIDPDDSFSSVPYEKGFNLLYFLEQQVGFDNFIKFMKSYIEEFASKSIDTNDFKNKLFDYFKDDEINLNKLNNVDWNKWLFSPGMPPLNLNENEIPFKSKLVDEVNKLVKLWDSNDIRDLIVEKDTDYPYSIKNGMTNFNSGQKVVFLESLTNLKPFSILTLNSMDKFYNFNSSQNCEILFRWLTLLLFNKNESHYIDRIDLLKSFLLKQGRMKYTRPLYRLWYKSEKFNNKKEFESVNYFNSIRKFYHPICESLVAKDLEIN